MFHRSTAQMVFAATVILSAMLERSTAWAQYGNHYGHGHAGFSRYGTTTAPSVLPPGYQPFPSQALPSRVQPAQIGSYYPSLPGPAVKPFSNYQPAPPINPRKYMYSRRGYRN